MPSIMASSYFSKFNPFIVKSRLLAASIKAFHYFLYSLSASFESQLFEV